LKSLASKRTDWVRIAFILKLHGEMQPSEISHVFCKAWPTRSRSSREVAQIMTAYRRHGFVVMDKHSIGNDHFKMYGFVGTIPNIPRTTLGRWRKQINPYGVE
jgi:hypothetical protein